MMRRRFRKKASWAWAQTGFTALVTDSAVAPLYAYSDQLLPVARNEWLLDQQIKRNSLTVQRILLWYKLVVQAPLNAGGLVEVIPPDVQIGIWKYTGDNFTVIPQQMQPYSPPAVPSSVTTWGTLGDSDGLEPFLWTDYVFVPESNVQPVAGLVNQTGTIYEHATYGASAIVRFTNTASFWHYPGPRLQVAGRPTLDLKVKRKLQRNNGLAIGFYVNGNASNCSYQLGYATRVLVS